MMILKQAYLAGYHKVQDAFKDSMIHDSAIHITYRISLRSSSLREPRDPLSKVVKSLITLINGLRLEWITRDEFS